MRFLYLMMIVVILRKLINIIGEIGTNLKNRS